MKKLGWVVFSGLGLTLIMPLCLVVFDVSVKSYLTLHPSALPVLIIVKVSRHWTLCVDVNLFDQEFIHINHTYAVFRTKIHRFLTKKMLNLMHLSSEKRLV